MSLKVEQRLTRIESALTKALGIDLAQHDPIPDVAPDEPAEPVDESAPAA